MKREESRWEVMHFVHRAILRFGLLILCIQLLAGTAKAAESREFKIVHSNNLQGYLLPCPT